MQQHSRRSLTAFLDQHDVCIPEMDLPMFRSWLQQRINHAAKSDLFRYRCAVRDIRRTHRRGLRDRQRRLEAAEAAWQTSALSARFTELEKRLDSLGKAVDGLTQAVTEGRASSDKLGDYREQWTVTSREHEQLLSRSPEARRLARAKLSCAAFEHDIGLTEALQQTATSASEIGTAAARSGRRFEEVSADAVDRFLRPMLIQPNRRADSVLVLHGATLGCARGEFDHILVEYRGPDRSVHVLAIVEAKRNINDIAHGFRLRQENLAWFVSDTQRFDPDDYRTAEFPDGLFDHSVRHAHDDLMLRLDPESFVEFRTPTDDGFRLAGLCFVTEERPLLGLTAAELSRLMYDAALNPRLQLDDHYQLAVSDRTLKRIQSELVHEMISPQAHQVLSLYAVSEELSRQILFA